MRVENVVVMGGSFDPPTIAHLKLMQAALDALDSDSGYFVPVSFAYLKRKMIRAGTSHLCLPDEVRLEMLRAMCAGDARLSIHEGEMREAFAVTDRTMEIIQQAHPGANVFFVFGADKLELLEHFIWKWDFLYKYRAVVFRRGGDLEAQLDDYAGIRAFRGSIAVVEPPAGLERVSSTAVRAHLFDPDAVADMLHPAVLNMLRALRPSDYPEEILQFKGEYAFLSNLFPSAFSFEGITWSCAEAAYQASKTDDAAERRLLSQLRCDGIRQRGGRITPRPGWEARRDEIMRAILREKFSQNPPLREALLGTQGYRLINGGKRDKYWGVSLITWEGENRLGEALMQLREAFRRGL